MLKQNGIYRTGLKVTATLVVCLFFSNSVVWAYPDTATTLPAAKSDLQVQSIFRPLVEKVGRQNETQVRLELACIMSMALRIETMPFQDMNSEIDKWLCAEQPAPKKRILDVVSNPKREKESSVVVFRIFNGPNVGKTFRLTLNCSSLDELNEAPEKVVIEQILSRGQEEPIVGGDAANAGVLSALEGEEPAAFKMKKMKFEDTGRLMVGTALDDLLGEKLAGQVQLIARRSGGIYINRRPSITRDGSGNIVNDIMGQMWDGITVRSDLGLSPELLMAVQKTYYLAALYEFMAKECRDPKEKVALSARAAKVMQDATDELSARGVKEPVRSPSSGPDHLIVKRNSDLLGLLVLKLKKDQERTAVFTAGTDNASFGITVDVDENGRILEFGSAERPVLSYPLTIDPMDETLGGVPSDAHVNVSKAVEQYNQFKKRSDTIVRQPKKIVSDDSLTMKMDPAAGEDQIGKRAVLLGIRNAGPDNALHGWKVARVRERGGEIYYLLLDMKGDSYFATLAKNLAAAPYVEDKYKAMFQSLLDLIKDAPPEMAVFDDHIEDFFGFARPKEGKNGTIGLYKDFSNEPIAQLHEIMELLASSRRVKFVFTAPLAIFLKRARLDRIAARAGLFRGKITVTDAEGRQLGNVPLSGDALSIALKDPALVHNRIRALQRQVFGDADREMTSWVKNAQTAHIGVQRRIPKAWEKMPIKGVMPIAEGFGGRLFTVGDVHGDLEALRETLEGLGLIKRGIHEDGMDDTWTGGTAIVVQGGDVIDRGPKSLEVLYYLRRLQSEAAAHHGQVVRLIGNHELYYLLRYDKGRWEGLIEVLKKKEYLRGFDEGLWEDDKELVKILREDIQNNLLIGAYQVGGKVFTHAAVSPEVIEYLGLESEEDVTQPKVFCEVVNRILKSSVKASRFDSVIFAKNGSADWKLGGIFSEYPSEMILQGLGYPVSVTQSFSPLSLVKLLIKEAGDGSGDVDKFSFDEVVFHDPRPFLGLMDIVVIKGKKSQKSLVFADVGMVECFGGGRAAILFEGGGVYKVLPKAVLMQEDSDEYFHSLPDFKVAFMTGSLLEAGLKKLRDGAEYGWIKNSASLSRMDGRITNFDLCMLPILERVPAAWLSGEDWGIYEFTEDGIGYGTAETGEFIRFTKDGKRLISEFLGEEEKAFFDGNVDYLSKVRLMLPDLREKATTSGGLLQRGNDMVLKAVAAGQAKPQTFVSQNELQYPAGPMVYDSLSLRMVLGLLERMPGILTVDTKREDWYWVPKRGAIKFVNRATGETETVKYSSAQEAAGLAEAARVKAALSLLRRSALNKAVNFLDNLSLDYRGTVNDRLRYELMRDFMESVPLAYDHPLIFDAVAYGEKVDAGSVLMHRFTPHELRLMHAALSAFPKEVLDYVRAQSFSYRPVVAMPRAVIYSDKSGERYRNPSMIVPSCSGYARGIFDMFVSSGEIKAYLATLEKGRAAELAYVADILKERARLFYDFISVDYLKAYAGFSWDVGLWNGCCATKKQEEAESDPNGHFLFARLPSADSSEEDFIEHVTAYVLFGPQFRKAAERSKALAAKYDFIKKNVFDTIEFERNYDFRETVLSIPANGSVKNVAGPSSKNEHSPDMAGEDVPHGRRNEHLAALIKAGRVYRVSPYDVRPERFRKGRALTLGGRVFDLLDDITVRGKTFMARIMMGATVQARLSRIRRSGLVEKAAYDASLDVAGLARSLGVSEDPIRAGLEQVAATLDILVVRGRLSLYDDGPIAHMRRGVTQGQDRAAIWLGEKLFTLKDVEDKDIARLIVEESLHFLYPDAGHDVIKHSKGLSSRLMEISGKIGEKPGAGSCEADMAFGPSLSQGMELSQGLVPQQKMLLESVLEQIQELDENEPEPEKARKGLEGLVEADRILKERGAIGIVVGSVSAALYGTDVTVPGLAGHPDVDVVALTPGFKVQEPFEGGIDWWLPMELPRQHNIEDAGGDRLERIFVNSHNYFIRAGMKLNMNFKDVKEMKPGLYLPEKNFLVDLTRAVAMASIDSRIEVDDGVIMSLSDKIDKAMGEDVTPLWAKTFGSGKMMRDEFVEITDFNLDTVRGIQNSTKFMDTDRWRERADKKDQRIEKHGAERGSLPGEESRMRYDLPESMAGIKGINLIDIIEETLDEQFGGKRSYVLIPFGSAVYLRDRSDRIAWEYLNDIDVQVLFFEDMGIAKRREAAMGSGFVNEFRRRLAANLEKRGANTSLSEKVDVSFEDEALTKRSFDAYFDDVMPYMAEVFGKRKALKIFRDYLVPYRTAINLYDRYDSLWDALSEEGLTQAKKIKRLIALAAIRGDREAVDDLMSELRSPGMEASVLAEKVMVSPDDVGSEKFFEERIPTYGSELLKNINAELSLGNKQTDAAVRKKKGRSSAVSDARSIERELRAGSIASQQLFRVIKDHVSSMSADVAATGRVQPIDVMIDLSLLSKEDVTKNMETWAQLVLMCREMENVNFIFEIPALAKPSEGVLAEAVEREEANAPSQREALTLLSAEIKTKAVCLDMPQGVEEFIKRRVNAPRRDGAVEIAIMSKKRLQLLRSTGEGIKANQYPVALAGISCDASGKIALRHFESALTIGLAEAALVFASKRAEAGESGAVLAKEELKKKMLEKLQKVYSVFREDVKLTEKTLDNMVSPYAEVRTNLAISLALPPMARMVYQKLLELHNGLQLFLQSA